MERKYRRTKQGRREFLEDLRRSRREVQKNFHRKNPLANKYYCWCGQKTERREVSIEKFTLFYQLAVKDKIGRINSKSRFNRRLMDEMGMSA